MKVVPIILYSFVIFSLSTVRSDGVEEDEAPEAAPAVVESIFSENDEEQFAAVRKNTESSTYQTEVSQMMKIIVNNLYGNKDVFLRELISNSFDAHDKVRYLSLQNSSILGNDSDLSIRIRIDPVNRILSITDNGIGMTKEELLTNLGTIAKSGTKDFIRKLTDTNTSATELSSQIGQFGVGFYSVFLVSDKVLVVSKSFNDSKQYIFEATTSSFNIYEDPRGVTLSRGTTVVMYLNEESGEFLKDKKIIGIIKKYSEFIQFPIFLYTNTDEEGKEVPFYWKHVNDVEPIWLRPKENITHEEYVHFYNALNYGPKKEKYDEPFGIIHFHVEGQTEFKALLFLPRHLDDDYINNPMSFSPKLKLYVRRVFISGGMRSMLPHYLSHIVGIVDSQDLPLNVGREMPQHKELIKVMKKKLTRKILDYIKKMTENETEYMKYYEEAGNALKFGVIEDESNGNRIAKLLRYYSSASTDKMISLETYCSRMKPQQPGILFIAAPSVADAKKSPYMERMKHKGYEVLFMTDNMDEAVMQSMRTYDNKGIYSIAKEIQDLPQTKSEEDFIKGKEAEFKPMLTWLKKSYYKGNVSSVRLSSKLVTSACILVAPEQGYSGNMERIVRSQTYVHGKQNGMEDVLNQPKNIEMNPAHPLVKQMLNLFKTQPESEELKESADVCLSIATLSGGYTVNDGVQLSAMIEKLYLKRHNVDYENIVQQIHEELGIEEEEEEESKEEPESQDTDSDEMDSEEETPLEQQDDPIANEEL